MIETIEAVAPVGIGTGLGVTFALWLRARRGNRQGLLRDSITLTGLAAAAGAAAFSALLRLLGYMS